MKFNEETLELAVIDLFEAENIPHQNGKFIHKEMSDVLLRDDLRAFLFNQYSGYATTPDTFETDILKLEELYSTKDIVKYLKLTTESISNKVCISVAKRYNVKPFLRFSL